MKVAGKIWVENKDGEKIFGLGICELLKGVGTYGSLSESAKQMSMSYNKAHNLVKTMERRLGFDIITTKIGGARGGGSKLTEKGIDLIKRYEDMMVELRQDMAKASEKYFSDFMEK